MSFTTKRSWNLLRAYMREHGMVIDRVIEVAVVEVAIDGDMMVETIEIVRHRDNQGRDRPECDQLYITSKADGTLVVMEALGTDVCRIGLEMLKSFGVEIFHVRMEA